MSFSSRIQAYTHLSSKLSCLSDVKLTELVHESPPLHIGIGGKSALLSISDTNVFVKKIPLTDLERQPEHVMSTANLFDLPLFYQYGVGSAGFGAWRELCAHIMTTNWVLAQECSNFPLMYHWRLLPTQPEDLTIEYWGDLESYAAYWENSLPIRKRLEAIRGASAHIVLFLEYVPQTLYGWLGDQLKQGGSVAESAIAFVDKTLRETNGFMNARGFLHFDAHFDNILTDGKLLYLSDFGLALSSQFDLTKAEIEFLNAHRTYDQCAAVVNLLHTVITHLFGKDQWDTTLQAITNGEQRELARPIAAMIKHYAPIALIMDEFYQKLQKESKSTPYPAAQLEHLLNETAT